MADVQYYRDLALNLVLALLEQELALVVPAEVVAKLGDDPRLPLPGRATRIDQHHLGWAINELVRTGQVRQLFHNTKGARTVRLIVPVNQRLRTRAIHDAVQRKAALHARYLGWASGTPNHPGILGAAAESVVHRALTAANGYLLLNPNTGQTTVLRGATVPGGPLDNAAILTVIDASTNTPTATYDVVVEVKNTRPWIYPGDDELHQLLWKAAALQQALPDTAILPVLVCRQAAHVTVTLTKTLGAYVVRTVRQLAPANIDQTKLAEVTDELGYRIDSSDDPAPALINHFTTLIPAAAAELATQWRTFGSTFLPLYELLRRDDLERCERTDLRQQLLDAASVIDYGSRRTSEQDNEVPWDHT
ncbi:MAG: hypothetical protein L0H64_10765 [Pseudonocardia sp.]|nr:hypothetical protein [Pseudonocardia sp.]